MTRRLRTLSTHVSVAISTIAISSGLGCGDAGEPEEDSLSQAEALTTNGLRGDYFTGTSFEELVLTRTDPTVAFDWGAGSPAAGIGVDHFSVRWTGDVAPLYTESYRFTTTSDDGVRLWVNGQPIIDDWTLHGASARSGTIALTAGQHYSIKLEYFENAGKAVAKLAWSSTHQASQIVPQSQLHPPATGPKYLRGINTDNFANTTGYGDGYGPAITSLASYRYLYGRGLRLIRIHVPWGKLHPTDLALQPVRSGPLDPTYISRLHGEIDNVRAAGLVAIIDIYGSCRYPTDQSPAVCGDGVTIAEVKDLWTRLSKELKGDAGVYAYDLMNEPHDMDAAVWKQYSQAMVDAIRANGDDKLIWVEGAQYSSAHAFAAVNGAPWINDPLKKIVYSGHEYPPTSDGGSWKHPDYTPAAEQWIPLTQKFYDWCKQYGQTCSIGEASVASSKLTTTWPQWNDLLDRWYAAADAAGVSVTYYAATSAWNQPNRAYDNAVKNTVTVKAGVKPSVIADIDEALSPATIIEKHPSR